MYVPRLGTDVGVAGGVVAAAVVLGIGAAHAAPADDGPAVAAATASAAAAGSTSGSGFDGLAGVLDKLFGIGATTGSAAATTNPADLLSTATTNFTDADHLLTGMDVSGVDSQLQLPEIITAQTGMLDTVTNVLTDYVGPVESAVSADSGSLSGLVDQLFFDPLNQNWADASTALLAADQGLDTAVAGGVDSDISSALLQIDGIELSQVLPAVFESIPFIIFSPLFGVDVAGDAAAAAIPDLLNIPF